MSVNDLNTKVVCQICHKPFNLTRDFLEEKSVVLEKEGLEPKEVVLTTLICPNCGKSYPVTLDDERTRDLVKALTELHKKSVSLQLKGRKTPTKLNKNLAQLERKLDFNRNQLAIKYTGSFYQTEDGKEQLDYRYHG